MSQTRYRFLLLPILLLLASVFAHAQANSQLTGIVTDQSGAVIPGAAITLTDPNTGSAKETVSGPTGLYTVPGLNPASYNLKVSAAGFQTYEQNGITVNVSSTTRVDVKLTVGAQTQTVTVAADALTVQADSNVVSTLISSQQISQIATQNRNFAALAALGLGVSSALPDSNTPTSVASNFTISVNGLRQSHNIWLIDGGEADDRGGAGGMSIMPSQDAIAEFNMLSSNYPPDYGISSGATISLSLKSGTNKFHGTLWEFNRNKAYDAKDPITGTAADLHYNIFGGNVGGPLFIPGVYNTDRRKTFFFVNEEWRKLLNPAGTTNVATLSAEDRPVSGQDLVYTPPAFATDTQLIVPVVSDPAYNTQLAGLGLTPGQPFPGNKIPHQLFDPNAVLYLNSGIIPLPTTSDGYAQANTVNPIDVRDDIVRIDHRFNDKWTILGHYMHDSVSQGYGLPFLGWLWASYNTVTSTLQNPSNSAAIKLSGTINPNLLVEASINYDGNTIDITNSDLANKPSGWSVQPFFPTDNPYVPGVGGGWGNPYNVAEDLGSAPWHNAAQDYMPRVDISYTMGKHAMKFGFSYNRYTKNQQLFGDNEGNYGFGTLTNDSFMDMLLGLTSSYQQFSASPIRHYVNQTPSVYAMDNWHVTPRLSLQLGLRYDALPHAWERGNYVSNFDSSLYLSSQEPIWNSDGSLDTSGPGFQVYGGTSYYLNGMGLAGQNGFPRGLVTNDYGTLQPRIGFSEDLFGNGKTVLRGGFGTFFERMQGNDIYNAATAPPFAFNPKATNVYMTTPTKSWVSGQSASTPYFAADIMNLAKNYPAPAVAQFSLGVQHELAPSMIWVVQYVGNLAWHQNVERHINNFPLDTPLSVRCDAGDGSNKYAGDNCSTLANSNIYRTYQGWGDINQQENTTNGNYNGFQTGLRIQNKWGLSGEVDYTWSHEIDITSYDLNGVSNPFNLKYDKGSGALDRRQILSANYVYNLPFFTRSAGITKSVLGGWQIAGTVTSETGTIPANQGPGLSIDYDPIGLGGGYTNRPDQNSKTKYLKKRGEWFDTSAFSAPIPVWAGGANQGFGNARKDTIVGPSRVNFTTSLYKSFAITERAHFELRFESFNTFNHTQYNGLNVSYGNSQFGQITSAWDPRTLELGGKFVF
ncbi:MAG TPA: TonB-dependent receptor [Terracidiphilus sp.]|nr:TonB-dependent receptor [Terracidiphilus sp.]